MHPTITRARPGRIALSVLLGVAFFAPIAVPGAPAGAAVAPTKLALKFDGKTKKLTGFPAAVPGGLTTITLTAGSYGVSLQLARLTSTRTDAEIEKNINSEDGPPPWVTLQGGTAGGARAGVPRTATVNLEGGNYIWVVFSDGGELDKTSPWARFTVTGAKSATEPSGPKSSVRTLEYGFDLTGLVAGRNTVVYRNGGREWHHIVMQKLMPGKTLADFQKALAAPQNGPPPVGLTDDKASAQLPVLSPGLTEVADFTLTRGTYVFLCFMPDAAGKPHFMDGMIREVKIT